MIKVVGLGPGSTNSLTLGSVEALTGKSKVFLRTMKHPTVSYIDKIGVQYNTFDDMYETNESFEGVYNSIVKELINAHKEYGDIVYAVPGHPMVAEKSVELLREACLRENIKIEIIPAVSFVDAVLEALKIDIIGGVKIIDAFDLKGQIPDKRCGIIITQVYNQLIATEVKLWISNFYGDETQICFVRAAGIEGLESVRRIQVYELDRQPDIDYLTSIFIPKGSDSKKDFYDLVSIMDTLRSENGCPWDKEQTHDSLKKYLIEESYEAIDAISNDDIDGTIEELGDVLLQIVFHAKLGSEEGYYDINDIITGVCDKMILRHPHVFGSEKCENSDEVLINWDNIKKKEKKLDSYTDEIRHIAKSLPSLIRADKVQRKAAKAGFDWDEVEGALNKVSEELNEVIDVYKGKNRARILEEIGDLLFSVVNIARFLDIDPEDALNYSIEKFINRFQYIEENLKSRNLDFKNLSLEELDSIYNEAKTKEKIKK